MSDTPEEKPEEIREPILSPIQRAGVPHIPRRAPMPPIPPQPKVRHVQVEHHEHKSKNGFLTYMADLGLMLIGWGAVYSFSAYPPGSPADIAGTIALGAYIAAAVAAIREHSQEAQVKEARKELGDIIQKTLKDLPLV